MYENRNVNENLWKSIRTSISKISEHLQSTLKETDFQYKYSITDYCWAENDNFINVSEITIPVPVFYAEKRFSDKERQWRKQKQKIESQFQAIFKQFQLPEQIYLAKPNPLLKTTPVPQLMCDGFQSELMEYKTIEKTFGFNLSTEYDNLIKFKFSLDKDSITLSDQPSVGLNFIKDNETVIYQIKCQVYICSELDYVRFVTNSQAISPSIYTDYLKQQLSAFFADTTYPAPKIDLWQSQQLCFDGILFESNKAYRNPDGDVIVLNSPDMTFDNYIKETVTGYDADKKKIVKPVGQVLAIQNKILNIDSNSLNLIYTDEVGAIKVFDLKPYCPVEFTNNFRAQMLGKKATDFQLEPLVRILERDNPFLYKQVGPDCTLQQMFEMIEVGNPGYLSRLNSGWFTLDLPVHIKLKFKIYLYLYCIGNANLDNQLIKEADKQNLSEEFAGSAHEQIRVPKFLSKSVHTNIAKTAMIDKTGLFCKDTFIERFMCLLANEKIAKGCIITTDCDEYFKSKLLDKSVNKIIVDQVTFPNLVKEYQQNLITYFQNIPDLSIVLIDPRVLQCTNLLGEAQLNLGSEIFFRNLVAEFFLNVHFDFVAVDFDKVDVYDSNFINQMCSRAKYCSLYTSDCSKQFLDNCSAVDIQCYYNFQDGNIVPIIQPRFSFKSYPVKLPDLQNQFYLDLYLKQKLQMDKDKQYLDILSDSSFNSFGALGTIQYKYFGFSNLFANFPDSDFFLYKQGKKPAGCQSSKLEMLFHYILCNFVGGVFDEQMVKAPNNSIVIVCSDLYSCQQVTQKFNERFKDGILTEEKLSKIAITYFDVFDNVAMQQGDCDVIFFNYQLTNSYVTKIVEHLETTAFATPFEFGKKINFIFLYYESTVENTFLNCALCHTRNLFNQLTNKPKTQVPDDYQFDNEPVNFSEVELQLNNLALNLETIAKQKTSELEKNILARYNYSISQQKIADMCVDVYTKLDFRSKEYMYPFKNNMICGMNPICRNLGFVDENGNKIYLENHSFMSDYVLTEIGVGKIVSSQNETKVIDICHYKPVVFDKELVFLFPQNFPTNQLEDLKNNFPVRYDLLNITGKKQDEVEQQDEPETIDLKLGFVNGYPAMYSTDSESDLGQYGLNYFKNVFVINVESEDSLTNLFNAVGSQLAEQDKANLQNVYKQYCEKKAIKIPEQLNFFVRGNLPDANLKIYPVTINEKFFLFISGYLYHKQCFKLSKKFDVSMISTLYYKLYNATNDLRVGLMQLLKVANVSNAQECLNFFTEKHPVYQMIELGAPQQQIQQQKPQQPHEKEQSGLVSARRINPLFSGVDALKARVSAIRNGNK